MISIPPKTDAERSRKRYWKIINAGCLHKKFIVHKDDVKKMKELEKKLLEKRGIDL